MALCHPLYAASAFASLAFAQAFSRPALACFYHLSGRSLEKIRQQECRASRLYDSLFLYFYILIHLYGGGVVGSFKSGQHGRGMANTACFLVETGHEWMRMERLKSACYKSKHFSISIKFDTADDGKPSMLENTREMDNLQRLEHITETGPMRNRLHLYITTACLYAQRPFGRFYFALPALYSGWQSKDLLKSE